MNPKVSIIVPVYNVAPYLTRCLSSLAAQTLDAVEVLVINDGSTDNSPSIIDDFVGRYPHRFRSFVKPNGGPSSARNMGIENARGEYVGFVDGDDWVDPDMYLELFSKANTTDADIVVCGYVSVDLASNGRRYHRQGWSTQFGMSMRDNHEYPLFVAPYACNKLFRRALIVETGIRFPESLLFEDIPFTYSILVHANKVEKVQRALYMYARSRPGSTTHSYSPRNLEMLQTLTMLNDYYQSHGLFSEFEDELLKINLRHIYYRFNELPAYDGVAIKQRFITLSRAHLDGYFPDWHRRLEWLEQHGHPWRLPFFRHLVPARLYALMPRFLHVTVNWFAVQRTASVAFMRRFSSERRVRLHYARFLRREKVDASTAFFESDSGLSTGDSPLRLMQDLARRGTHRVIVGTADVKRTEAILQRHEIVAKPVTVGSKAHAHALATAGLVVSNAPLPPFFVKRPEQVYLNTLNGMPLRKLGRGARKGFGELPQVQGDLIKADYLLFPDTNARDLIMGAYMLSAQYGGTPLVGSLPRNQILADESRRRILRDELDCEGVRVCLFMPERHAPAALMDAESYARQLEDFLGDFDAPLDDRFRLIVRPAMQLEDQVDFTRFRYVELAPPHWDDHELLCVADCLITDQSSTLFDFLATGRQIVRFRSESDSSSQDTERFSEDELPFRTFHSAKSVGEHLARTADFVAPAEYRQFAERFASPLSASAAADLNDVVLGIRHIEDPAPVPAVDIVFIRYLTKNGRVAFEKLLESGYHRDDAVFVMSGHRYRARASAYLHELHTKRGVDVNYRVTSDRILLTTATVLMAWASRRFGWRFASLDRAYLQEARRIFGTTHVRSATDFSGYKKFSAMARVIDEHADSRPL